MTTTQQGHSTATESADQDPRDNTVTWWEIQVPDLAEAREFYGAVFGWTFVPFGDDFVICQTPDGTMIGGLEVGTGDPVGRQVTLYMQVRDLEATLERVTAAGGTVVRGHAVVSEDYGWSAMFTDPSGVKIGLVTDRPATAAADAPAVVAG